MIAGVAGPLAMIGPADVANAPMSTEQLRQAVAGLGGLAGALLLPMLSSWLRLLMQLLEPDHSGLGRQQRLSSLAVARALLLTLLLGFIVMNWQQAASELQQVQAEAPLWVVYSSGTTGLPKGLVHSHVGVMLMGLAQLGLQYDVREGDRFCWYSSTSWIMWNTVVMSLMLGATAVLYDGSPLWPGPDRLWQLAAEQRQQRHQRHTARHNHCKFA